MSIAEMEAQGTTILAAAVDVSDEAQVAQLMAQLRTTCPPLRAIFHGAMVLDDGFLVDMTRARFEKVMAPKVAGALNLHTHTKAQPLDFFISFSSISSLIGNVGQANYVAANAFLDAFLCPLPTRPRLACYYNQLRALVRRGCCGA
jgi:NAD(P)-dependent dehydrogenase (short-subunit alcohol dehydrogenase family)